jgi:undecaprenyl-diphosphatase
MTFLPNKWVHSCSRWLKVHSGASLTAALVSLALLASFVRLVGYVGSGETHALDESLVRALRSPSDPSDPFGPAWFEEMMRDYTALGGVAVLMLVIVGVIGFLVMSGRRSTGLALFVITGSGFLTTFLLKGAFARPRPDLVPHGMHVLSLSFPSGHSMMSAVCYLTLAAILSRVLETRAERVYVLVAAVAITVIVGTTRIYLGVHWPSDVLAGWAAGGAWALAAWVLMRWLQRRGAVEPSPPGVDPVEA